MKKNLIEPEIILPRDQLYLFGYKKYFNVFIKLFSTQKAPHAILLKGPKGIGKSTFIYHFTNYLLSKNNKEKYLINDFTINIKNNNYNLVKNNSNQNFFLVNNNSLDQEIKIEQIRNLIKFLNKSTYSQDLKIIMIDNSEDLNVNSSNALLKAIEEPSKNTHFFIVNNNSKKISDTIKSRCVEFKIFFTQEEKKAIFDKIIKQYNINFKSNSSEDNLYFDTPGNHLKYLLTLDNKKISKSNHNLENILHFIEKYNKEKNPEILYFISLFIEKFYHDLCLLNVNKINTYFYNNHKILKQLRDMKKYNLNEKNIFIWIKEVLCHES